MRIEGWEGRLWKVLEAAQARPYELGVHDCFRVACEVIEALTGRDDLWARFSGYRTREEARAYIARYGSSFERCFDHVFGVEAQNIRLARRGDIVALQTADGEKHLAVCLGVEAACLGPEGLLRVPTLTCLCAWRV